MLSQDIVTRYCHKICNPPLSLNINISIFWPDLESWMASTGHPKTAAMMEGHTAERGRPR